MKRALADGLTGGGVAAALETRGFSGVSIEVISIEENDGTLPPVPARPTPTAEAADGAGAQAFGTILVPGSGKQRVYLRAEGAVAEVMLQASQTTWVMGSAEFTVKLYVDTSVVRGGVALTEDVFAATRCSVLSVARDGVDGRFLVRVALAADLGARGAEVATLSLPFGAVRAAGVSGTVVNQASNTIQVYARQRAATPQIVGGPRTLRGLPATSRSSPIRAFVVFPGGYVPEPPGGIAAGLRVSNGDVVAAAFDPVGGVAEVLVEPRQSGRVVLDLPENAVVDIFGNGVPAATAATDAPPGLVAMGRGFEFVDFELARASLWGTAGDGNATATRRALRVVRERALQSSSIVRIGEVGPGGVPRAATRSEDENWQVLSTQLLWLAVALVAATAAQLAAWGAVALTARRRRPARKPAAATGRSAPPSLGAFTFPRLQLLVLFFFVPASGATIGSMLRSGDDAQVAVAVVFALLVPVPLLAFMFHTVVATQVSGDVVGRAVAYEVKLRTRAPPDASWLHRCLHSAPAGEWRCRDAAAEAFATKYGLAVRDMHGAPVVRLHATFELDPATGRYQRGYFERWDVALRSRAPGGGLAKCAGDGGAPRTISRWERVSAFARVFGGTVRLLLLFLLALASTGLAEAAPAAQLSVLAVIVVVDVALLLALRPFARAQDQLLESVTALCETLAVALLAAIVAVSAHVGDVEARADAAEGLGFALVSLIALALLANVCNMVRNAVCALCGALARRTRDDDAGSSCRTSGNGQTSSAPGTPEWTAYNPLCDARGDAGPSMWADVEDPSPWGAPVRGQKHPRVLAAKYSNRWRLAAGGRRLSTWPTLAPRTPAEVLVEIRHVALLRAADYPDRTAAQILELMLQSLRKKHKDLGFSTAEKQVAFDASSKASDGCEDSMVRGKFAGGFLPSQPSQGTSGCERDATSGAADILPARRRMRLDAAVFLHREDSFGVLGDTPRTSSSALQQRRVVEPPEMHRAPSGCAASSLELAAARRAARGSRDFVSQQSSHGRHVTFAVGTRCTMGHSTSDGKSSASGGALSWPSIDETLPAGSQIHDPARSPYSPVRHAPTREDRRPAVRFSTQLEVWGKTAAPAPARVHSPLGFAPGPALDHAREAAVQRLRPFVHASPPESVDGDGDNDGPIRGACGGKHEGQSANSGARDLGSTFSDGSRAQSGRSSRLHFAASRPQSGAPSTAQTSSGVASLLSSMTSGEE
ncbi:unnamed protein product [Pedinophyceae sp. YPF-701]|nr:unnamed protein product [Pedinophyceae sp. YPF-701]